MEWGKLLATRLKVSWKTFIDFIHVVRKFYPIYSFGKIDLSLLLRYALKNPYRISKQFLKKQGESDIYAYGETSLPAIEEIANFSEIKSGDCVFELGCGRGRACFWLKIFRCCRVVGIEWIPLFVEKAQDVQSAYKLSGIEFRCEDMMASDFTGATVIYLYGTCYSEMFMRALLEKLDKLPKGTRLITVSDSLEEYSSSSWQMQKRCTISFLWGYAEVYLHIHK